MKHSLLSRLLPLGVVLALGSGLPDRAHAQWIEQGPGIIRNGQTEGIPDNPVVGAVNAVVAATPTDGNVVYIGTVNGGVWKTTNATAAPPTWTPLTDHLSFVGVFPGLSIASLAMSPTDPNTLFAGTGSTSAEAFEGGPGY